MLGLMGGKTCRCAYLSPTLITPWETYRVPDEVATAPLQTREREREMSRSFLSFFQHFIVVVLPSSSSSSSWRLGERTTSVITHGMGGLCPVDLARHVSLFFIVLLYRLCAFSVHFWHLGFFFNFILPFLFYIHTLKPHPHLSLSLSLSLHFPSITSFFTFPTTSPSHSLIFMTMMSFLVDVVFYSLQCCSSNKTTIMCALSLHLHLSLLFDLL